MSDTSTPDFPALGFAKELSEEERKDLGSIGDFVVAETGQTIIEEGNPQESLFLVISGTVHVQTNAGGRNILLSSLRAGDTIGEMNMFDPGVASATVVANDFSVLFSITREKLEDFMKTHPQATARMLISISTLLSKRLRQTNEKVAVSQQVMH